MDTLSNLQIAWDALKAGMVKQWGDLPAEISVEVGAVEAAMNAVLYAPQSPTPDSPDTAVAPETASGAD